MDHTKVATAVRTLSTKEVAVRLGISQSKVRKDIANGDLEGHAEHGAYRVPEAAVVALEQARFAEQRPTPPDGHDDTVAAEAQTQPAVDLPMLLTIEATAKFLGLSVPTVRDAMTNGQIPFVTVGSRRYGTRPALEAWMLGAA